QVVAPDGGDVVVFDARVGECRGVGEPGQLGLLVEGIGVDSLDDGPFDVDDVDGAGLVEEGESSRVRRPERAEAIAAAEPGQLARLLRARPRSDGDLVLAGKTQG